MYYFSPSRRVFNKTNKIWSDGVEVTDLRYETIISELEDGRVLTSDNTGAPLTILADNPPPLPALAKVYRDQLSKMNNDYEMMVACLKQSYPLSEAITWSVQRDEAKEVMAWMAADVNRVIEDFPRDLAPFLYDMAAARTAEGIEGGLFHLAERVLVNDSMFSPAMATITARRHAAEKLMLTALDAGDRQALKAITWNFNLQG